jgi:hypothetical protein
MKILPDMTDFHGIFFILRRGDALSGVECKRFPLASQVEAVPLQALSKGVFLLGGF